MHAVFVACLFGGAMATALFAILGFAGGAAGHGHVGSHGHLGGHGGGGAHAAPGAHAGGHAHALHGAPHGNASHSLSARGGDGQRVSPRGQAVETAGHTVVTRDAPVHAGAGHVGAAAGWLFSWLSPLTVAAAALWFGGAGLLAESSLGRLALVIAILAALAGAGVVRGVMNALVRASTPPLQLTAEGAIATVNAAIRPDAPGEVIYTLEGLHRSLPARSEEHIAIPRGTSVVITRCEKGMAWVSPLDPLQEVQSDVGESADAVLLEKSGTDTTADKIVDTNA